MRGGSLSAVSTVTLRGLGAATGDHRGDCHTNDDDDDDDDDKKAEEEEKEKEKKRRKEKRRS